MKIAVFCASSDQVSREVKEITFKLGDLLGHKGHILVYGGATGGLMDEIAAGFASAGAKIIGVVPKRIVAAGRQSFLPDELIQTEDMSIRKKEMKHIADLFLVLPGGFGTLDEMFDVIAAGIIGEHKKPLICFNYKGFYNDLIKLLDKMEKEHFISDSSMHKPLFVENVEECLQAIERLENDNSKNIE